MKCKVCEAEFFPATRGNITCSDKCRNVIFQRTMGNQIMKEAPPVKSDEEYMEERWQAIVKNPTSYSYEIIAEVMEWFNARDRQKIGVKLADYMIERDRLT